MTVKPETLFGKNIKDNIKGAFWFRVENRHGGGVPDLYGIKNKRPIWLELKCIKMNSSSAEPSNCTTVTKALTFHQVPLIVFRVCWIFPRRSGLSIIIKRLTISYLSNKIMG